MRIGITERNLEGVPQADIVSSADFMGKGTPFDAVTFRLRLRFFFGNYLYSLNLPYTRSLS